MFYVCGTDSRKRLSPLEKAYGKFCFGADDRKLLFSGGSSPSLTARYVLSNHNHHFKWWFMYPKGYKIKISP